MKPQLLALMLALPVSPAVAHHPGERIDEVMADREPDFEPTDLRRTPQLGGSATDGVPMRISDFNDKIVVVSFIPEACSTLCDAQQGLLREVQAGVNVTPMRDQVIFVTVGAASSEGWDDTNWQQLEPEGSAAEASAAFSSLSGLENDAPMIHIVDRSGRHAAIFHGADFGHVSLILYINELTNAAPLHEPGLLSRIFRSFR